jgi:hypothetical protein
MIPRDLYNDLVRLSTDERLSEAFRRACRVELGDLPGDTADELLAKRRVERETNERMAAYLRGRGM